MTMLPGGVELFPTVFTTHALELLPELGPRKNPGEAVVSARQVALESSRPAAAPVTQRLTQSLLLSIPAEVLFGLPHRGR